jgi:hypothetical protein
MHESGPRAPSLAQTRAHQSVSSPAKGKPSDRGVTLFRKASIVAREHDAQWQSSSRHAKPQLFVRPTNRCGKSAKKTQPRDGGPSRG